MHDNKINLKDDDTYRNWNNKLCQKICIVCLLQSIITMCICYYFISSLIYYECRHEFNSCEIFYWNFKINCNLLNFMQNKEKKLWNLSKNLWIIYQHFSTNTVNEMHYLRSFGSKLAKLIIINFAAFLK